MKKIWRRRITESFLKIFFLFLCQSLFGTLNTVDKCELEFEKNVASDDYVLNPISSQDYLLRHLPYRSQFLTDKEEQELTELYQTTKNHEKKHRAFNKILSNYIRLIIKFAREISNSRRRPDFFEDLIQDANWFIMKRLNNHDATRGPLLPFITTYVPKFMSSQISAYISPVRVDDEGRKEIKKQGLSMPITADVDTNREIDSKIELTFHDFIASWIEANENIKQIEDFILSLGTTPRQRYILRHRIFTLYPEPSYSIAEKFEIHPSGTVIGDEEKKLLKRISDYLGAVQPMEKDQIFIEISKRINEGRLFPLVNSSEMDFETEDLVIQIKYLIQEINSTPEQRRALKDQQAENLAKEAGLDEINTYILRYRLLEEPGEQQTSITIGEMFGVSSEAILLREKNILKTLQKTEFTSPELKEAVDIIKLAVRRKKTKALVMNDNEKDHLATEIGKEAELNEMEQHILRYQLMEEPKNRQTAPAIAEIFDVKPDTISNQKRRVFKKLQKTEFTSFKLKRIVEKILLEKKQNKKNAPFVDKNERDRQAEILAKKLEDFILEMGETPKQIYILRYRIFTFEPEPLLSIAEKFGENHHNYSSIEEYQLLQKISKFLSGKPDMNKDQIFREVVSRIYNGESFVFINRNELKWQIENLSNQAGLNEIEKHILRYRFMEERSKRQSLPAIGKIFGISNHAVRWQEESMLKKLKGTRFISPELKEIVEKVLLAKNQNKRSIPILDKEHLSQEQDILFQQLELDEVQKYIFEHRLLRDLKDRKTWAEIANAFDTSRNKIQRREKALLEKLQERGLASFQ